MSFFTVATVCVNYLDYLEHSYLENKDALQNHNYWIITSPEDSKTQKFCSLNNINCHITNEFYKNGNSFNKAAAINSLFYSNKININYIEWILLLDADIIIKDVMHKAYSINKDKNCLYSCGRKVYNTKNDYINKIFIKEPCYFIGFFQLFHKDKILNSINNNFLYEFRNSSVYDCKFADTFKCKIDLGEYADHLGRIAVNWDGRISQTW